MSPCTADRTASATVVPTTGGARRPCRAYTNLTHRNGHRELRGCDPRMPMTHPLRYGDRCRRHRRIPMRCARGWTCAAMRACGGCAGMDRKQRFEVSIRRCVIGIRPHRHAIWRHIRTDPWRNTHGKVAQSHARQARQHGASRRTEKKKTYQHRSRSGPGRFDASTERRWHSSPGRTGFVFRRLPARLVAVRTSRPVASPEAGREPHPPSTRSFKSCPELSLRPGLAGALFFPLRCVVDVAWTTQVDAAPQHDRVSHTSVAARLLRHRTHYGVRAWFFSTACSLWRDATRPLLTDLVCSVYGPGSRDVASGCATDITMSTATLASFRRPSAHRWRNGRVAMRSPALRSGNTHAAGRRRRPEIA